LRHRALLPRRAPVPPVRRHQPNPADRDRAQPSAGSDSLRADMDTTRIHTLFDAWLARDPQRVFIHLPDAQWTFAQLGNLVDDAEAELREEGVGSGDRILIVAENCPEHVA